MVSAVYLSKRNLLTLLSKLERKEKGDSTQCTLIKHKNPNPKFQQTAQVTMVIAVPDEEYYPALERAPGEVHPLDTPKE